MQRVAILITKSNWGGAQRYVYDLATGLDEHEFDVSVWYGNTGEMSDRLTQDDVATHSIPELQNTLSPIRVARMIYAIKTLLQRDCPDILHCNSSVAGLAGVIAGRMTGTSRIIYTAHGWAFNEDRPWLVRLLLKTLHWVTVLLAHQTIAVSSGLKQQLQWPGAARKMQVIPLGIRIDEHSYLPRATARTWLTMHVPAIQPETFVLMMIAELHPIKQHHRLLQALSTIPSQYDIQVVCIGDGVLKTKLTATTVQLGLQDRITFLGAVPNASQYLTGADALSLPSRSESFGYVLLEAGGAQVPVIASNVGGIPDIITDQHNGLLVSQSKTFDLAAAITRLYTDRDLRHRLGTELYNTAQSYDVRKMVRATATVYTMR